MLSPEAEPGVGDYSGAGDDADDKHAPGAEGGGEAGG